MASSIVVFSRTLKSYACSTWHTKRIDEKTLCCFTFPRPHPIPFYVNPPPLNSLYLDRLPVYVCTSTSEATKIKQRQNETKAAMCIRDPFNQHHAQDGCRIDGMLVLPRPVLQHSQTNSLLAIDPAEVAVPANGYDIGKQDAMLKRQEGKVDCLNNGPHQPVGLQGRPPRLLEALFGTGTLHGGHAAEESANHDGSKQRLVAGDAGESFNSRVPEVDVASQESEPGCGDRAKDAYALNQHWISLPKEGEPQEGKGTWNNAREEFPEEIGFDMTHIHHREPCAPSESSRGF